MTPEALTPVLLAVAGVILTAAGLLIITNRRRRSVTAVGALVLLAGIVTISPTTATETAGTAVTATSEAISGIANRSGPEPAVGEIVAVETPAAP